MVYSSILLKLLSQLKAVNYSERNAVIIHHFTKVDSVHGLITRQMLKHVGASLSCYTGFQVHCPIQATQKPMAIMYQQWLLLGLLTRGM